MLTVHAFTNLIARCEKYRVDSNLPVFDIIHDEQKHFDEILKANFKNMKNVNADSLPKDTFIDHTTTYNIYESTAVTFANSKSYKIIQIADLTTGFIMRSWNDFYFGDFKSFDRHKAIWKSLIFYDETHQSVGINMVVPSIDHLLLVKHLRK